MSVEELAEVMIEDEEDDDAMPSYYSWRRRQKEMARRKNRLTIDEFLGTDRRATAVGIVPRYYGELLTWALHRYMERETWQIAATLGYGGPEPVYIDVSTDYSTRENLPVCAQLLIERDDDRLVATIDVSPGYPGSVHLQGPTEKKVEIEAFIDGVMTLAKEANIYRGKKIEFGGRVGFLNVRGKSWDGIILDHATKSEVRANTIDFLSKRERWTQYGIPQKRGVLLAGEPGTGKTLVCKALMAEAEGITCITTDAYRLCTDEYITDLYEMAQDLSPCIVFIEDIDLIGLNREEYHYQHGPALLSLLNVLDGVEEKHEIVTVATTNNPQALDRAISRRPSRFDRVITLSLPSLEERRELVGILCRRIPIDGRIQDYLAGKSDRCTPAQLQELVFSLAIEYPDEPSESPSEAPSGHPSGSLRLSRDDVDRVISKIGERNGRRLGFDVRNHHHIDTPAWTNSLEGIEC